MGYFTPGCTETPAGSDRYYVTACFLLNKRWQAMQTVFKWQLPVKCAAPILNPLCPFASRNNYAKEHITGQDLPFPLPLTLLYDHSCNPLDNCQLLQQLDAKSTAVGSLEARLLVRSQSQISLGGGGMKRVTAKHMIMKHCLSYKLVLLYLNCARLIHGA